MAVRMKDIARDLGVSVVTVSKVLRNHEDIGEETRRRVLRRMKELDYHPNMAARALVTGRTYAVGLVVPDLVHPFFSEVAKGISGALRKQGYGLLISSSEENAEIERQEIESLLARHVDALIIASTQCTVQSFRRIEERKRPYVLVDRCFAGLTANFVGVDDEQVGLLATEHLIAVGCRRIAHIRGPEVSTALGRLAGYRKALVRRGLEIPAGYIEPVRMGDDQGDVGGHEAMQRILSVDPRPDGVFCYNDPTGMGALKAILESGLRVPQDIAVIGCGNVRHLDLLRVPLSSVDQDSAAIGQKAAALALKILESKREKPRPRTILLQPRIVARESTAGRTPA
jgi:LacI family transcriptional regulator